MITLSCRRTCPVAGEGKHGAPATTAGPLTETELLLGNVEGALERLERAVDAGWREYYLRQNDPYWASVADHPRYRAAMAKAKADVDRQRAEVRRIDAREDFPAKLDAKIAAEKTRAP